MRVTETLLILAEDKAVEPHDRVVAVNGDGGSGAAPLAQAKHLEKSRAGCSLRYTSRSRRTRKRSRHGAPKQWKVGRYGTKMLCNFSRFVAGALFMRLLSGPAGQADVKQAADHILMRLSRR